jgi:hypothetical protein
VILQATAYLGNSLLQGKSPGAMLRVDFLKVRITSESQTSFNKEKVQSILHATRSADESREYEAFPGTAGL